MKRTTRLALVTTLGLALAATAAIAHPGFGPGAGAGGGCPGQGGPGMGMRGGAGYNAEARLAAQKDALKITAAQEAAWNAYAAQAKKQGESMQAHREAMFKSPPTTSAERQQLRADHMTQRATEVQEVNKAYQALYAALTPEQKAIADQRGAGFGPNAGPGRGAGFGRGPGAGVMGRW